MNNIQQQASARLSKKTRAFIYQTTYRWHFYAGLLVIPFLLMLSVTGTVMLYDEQIQDFRYGGVLHISGQGELLSPSAQLAIIKKHYKDAKVSKYIPAKSAQRASFVVIETAHKTLHIAINPYTGELLQEIDRDDSWYALANDNHGSLLLGDWGDRLIEAATGLIVLLILTGMLLWAAPHRATKLVWYPRRGQGKRVFYRELHSALGLYSLFFLLFFTLSGLSWSGVWGSKIVQAWSSFPTEKSAKNVKLSTESHAMLNQGVMEEMPWNLEQSKMPLSHTPENHPKLGIDAVTTIAKALNMPRYQLSMPASKEGVYTLSANTMSGDITDPRRDRTVHIDQYSGAVLVDIGWDDYSLLAKAMAAGVALHQGNASWFNLAINTLLCLVFMVISLTAIAMWWQRRPSNDWSLNAPQKHPHNQYWYLGVGTLVVIGVLFPLTGVVIFSFALIDAVAAVKRALSER